MIKTHAVTGLKYLCYTQKNNHDSYLGSGRYWKRHVQEHGKNIITEVIFQTEDYEEFVKIAKLKSIEFNVVESAEWANLKIEEGDGGDTVSSLRWITDGVVDKYFPKDKELPEGWRLGRSNCKFNDSQFQKEMSKRSHEVQTPEIRKQAGVKAAKTRKERGVFRDISGDKNPSKREDVRLKIKQSAQQRPIIKCPHCSKEGQASPGMYRFHFDNCKQRCLS
jgi:hypothetical protein